MLISTNLEHTDRTPVPYHTYFNRKTLVGQSPCTVFSPVQDAKLELPCQYALLMPSEQRFLLLVNVTPRHDTIRWAICCNPSDADAYNLLGVVLEQQENFSAAEAQYRRAMEIDPGLVKAHYNLGIVLVKQGKPEEARV